METIRALQIDKISDENECHGDKGKYNFYDFDNIKPNDWQIENRSFNAEHWIAVPEHPNYRQ